MPPLFDVPGIAKRFSGSLAAGQRGGGIMDQIAGYGDPDTELWKKQVNQVWNDPENEAYRQQFESHMETRNSREAQKALMGLTTNMLRQGLPGTTVEGLILPFNYRINVLSDEAKEHIKAMEFMLGKGLVEIDPNSAQGAAPPSPDAGQPPPMTAPDGGGVLLPDPSQPGGGIPEGGLPSPTDLRAQLPAAQQAQTPSPRSSMQYGGFDVRPSQRPTLGQLFAGQMDPDDPMASLPLSTEKAAEYVAKRYDEGTAFQQEQLAARLEALTVQREGHGVQREGFEMQRQRMQEDAAERARERETPYTLGQLDPEAPEALRGMPLSRKEGLGIYKNQTGGDLGLYQKFQMESTKRREAREIEKGEVGKLQTQYRNLEKQQAATIKAMSDAAGVPINPHDKYQLDNLSALKQRKIAPMYGLWRSTTRALAELYMTSPLLQEQFAVPPPFIPKEKRKKKPFTPPASSRSEEPGRLF